MSTDVTYGCTPNSNLIQTVTGPIHTVTNTWESNRDVLDIKENKVGTSVISKYDYAVNAIGQRTGLATSGTAFPAIPTWLWGYDSLGQVTSADSNVSTSDRAYQYDTIGNRKKSANSLTLPSSDNYTSNALNQYSAVESVSPTYDFDGNATAYPLPVAPTTNSTLVWDAENRQISSTVGSTTTSYLYDAQSRRIAKTTGGTSTLYVYDAWNCIAEYAGTSLSKTRLWGTNLSGTLQGAGGVGGLLAVRAGTVSHFPTYDGNGNVSEYLNSAGSIAAHFEYDPFGNTVVNTDTTEQFEYRFSTKPKDSETGLYYYGYRYYDPLTGRWPSREPMEEDGSLNLFSFVSNFSTSDFDILGLCEGAKKAMYDAACKTQKATEKDNKEKCAAVCCKDGIYTQTKWAPGTRLACMVPSCPKGEVKVHDIHSHPYVDGSPSDQDKRRANGDMDYWISTDAPFSVVDEEIWLVQYGPEGGRAGWIYNCKTGELKKRK